jgi:hypothetical protein
MNIYDKIKRMTCKESYDEKMYQLLSSKKYSNFPYSTQNLGET